MTHVAAHCPNGDCPGVLVVDEGTCKTSNPCQHKATCDLCGNSWTVYGSGTSGKCGPFHLSFTVAMKHQCSSRGAGKVTT